MLVVRLPNTGGVLALSSSAFQHGIRERSLFANVGGPQLCQRRPGHTDKQSRSVTKRPRAALLLL